MRTFMRIVLIMVFFFVIILRVTAGPTNTESDKLVEVEVYPISVSQTIEPSKPLAPAKPIKEVKPWTEEEVTVLAKMLWGEARGVPSDTEKAACIWCVLNRVDQGQGTIVEVVTAPYQFLGYAKNNPVEAELAALCEDVLSRWYQEKDGKADVGRVLPSDYLYFTGDGKHNHFRNAYENGERWTWDYESPYES